ncbi:MAG: 2-oxo acid dehydrogenase subunit E2 [Chloroflexota bacterium]|nr:2-oxo acid dehydrogenase subunit E2 [Chloroflexota bacterium]
MAIEVVMPRLGWNMEAGTVVEWLKHDGDPVKAGEYLFLVESDKATTEVESLDSGILRIPGNALRIGEELPVGTVLGYLVQEGESVPSNGVNGSAPSGIAAPPAPASAPSAPAVAAASQASMTGMPAASPRAIRIAGEIGVDWTQLTGSGGGGRIVERDVRAAAAQAPSGGADLHPVEKQDANVPPPATKPVAAVAEAATPISSMRRIIGERMAQSAHTVAPVTLTTEADATALVRLRSDIEGALIETETAATPTYNDLFAKLVAVALGEFPDLNASLTDGGIVRHEAVHMGIAVDTERGLLVPVIRDAQAKSIQTIATESARLIGQTRAGKASRDALQGGTFTITNLGMYGINVFTPIINLPECAILGIGRIVARPVVVDEEAGTVAVRKMVALSLTFDHRVVDGAPAARFLKRITQFIEQPLVWLTR